MKKNYALTVLFALIAGYCSSACYPDGLKIAALPDSGWLFTEKNPPLLHVAVNNSGATFLKVPLRMTITTDKWEPFAEYSKEISLATQLIDTLDFPLQLKPGFYRVKIYSGDSLIEKFNIGYEPEKIISPYDAQKDFNKFWAKTKTQLAKVDPEYIVIPLTKLSGKTRNAYLVRMRSLGGVMVYGYYLAPVMSREDSISGKKYPVLVTCIGYSSTPTCPYQGSNPEYAEFVLATRGQGIEKSKNIYGDWMTYGLENKDKYYYRGAFMDVVRAIDFVASRPEVDVKHIFAQGGSQGGGLTLAACALDHRICAAAPDVPFLSDYPDYFKVIKGWPADRFLKKQAALVLTDEELYKTLSYFDIKNLAINIKCPILMAFGLQDETCPPHTNISGYNHITSPKEYVCYSDKGHDVGSAWWNVKMNFFKAHR